MLKYAEGFNIYGEVTDLLKRASTNPLIWDVPHPSLLSIKTPSARGSGNVLYLGGNIASANPAAAQANFASDTTNIIGLGINPYFDQVVGTPSQIDIALIDSTGPNTQAQLQLNAQSGEMAVVDTTGTVVSYVKIPTLTGGWFYLEVMLTVGNPGSIQINIGGQQVYINNAFNCKGGSNTTWNGVVFGVPSSSGTIVGGSAIGDLYIENTAIGDGGVIPTNTFLGPVYVTPVPIVNNSTPLEWTPSTGFNWTNVNTPDDSNYNSATVSGYDAVTDLYLFGNVNNDIELCVGAVFTGLYSQNSDFPNIIDHESSIYGQNPESCGQVTLATSSGSFSSLSYGSVVAVTEPNGANWTTSSLSGMSAGPSVEANYDVITGGTLGGTLVSASGTINESSNTYTFGAVEGCSYSFTFLLPAGNVPYGLGVLSMGLDDGTTDFAMTFTNGEEDGTVTAGWYSGINATLPEIAGQYYIGSGIIYYTGDAEYVTLANNKFEQAGGGALTAPDTTQVLSYPFTRCLVATTASFSAHPYTVLVQEYTPPPPAVIKCSQFACEAVLFASNYGGNGGAGGMSIPPIFPVLKGLQFPLVKTPSFNNIISTGASGAEARVGFWQYPLWEWELDFAYLPDEQANGTSSSDLKTLMGFFLLVRANLLAFLFKDFDDYQVTAQALGTTDGTTSAFTFYRTYGGSDGTGTEPIGYIDPANAPEIFLNGELVSADDYVIVSTTPLQQQVVFNSVPTAGQALTWSGTFYYYVRFHDDHQDFTKTMNLLWETSKLKIRSLRQQ